MIKCFFGQLLFYYMNVQQLLNKNFSYRPNILVIGDSMIDEYYDVVVNRISPEAPILIMKSDLDLPNKVRPGGSANVAYQFRHWNVDCTLLSVMSSKDVEIFENNHLIVEPILSEIPLPRKKRFHQLQELIRWDVEKSDYNLDYTKKLICKLEQMLKASVSTRPYDVVILSDYDKGIFKDFGLTQQIITVCHTYGVSTIVDPKNEPIEKWSGCSIFKPNTVEAGRFTGTNILQEQVFKLADKLYRSNIVVTAGGDGVAGFDCSVTDSYIEYRSPHKINPESVIGAGDCFIAHLALSFSHGFSLEDCIVLAFKAGEVYVQRKHNKPVGPLEIQDSKYVDPRTLLQRNFKLVFTNGCFDILHTGHVKTLEFAKSKGDKLVVALNTDESVKKIKGESRPINCLANRKEMLASLHCVDYIIDFSEDSPYNVIKMIKPDVLVKGGDYTINTVRSAELVPEVYLSPLVEGCSTTKIIQKIKE
jgi:D-beta-D-heptose 7-phosphate kinase/D-beta-D-heptose 1-phosphate adenosyltransferase